MNTLADVKTAAEIRKVRAEISKIRAETRKLMRETGVIPFVAGAGFMVACTGLAALVLKAFGL